MNTSTHDASRAVQSDNFKGLTAAKLTRAEHLVMNAILLGHARRRRDFSLNEICNLMEEQLGERVNPNSISGRVTSLVASHRLARAEPRACSVTGAKCNPVFAVAHQAQLNLPRQVEIGHVKAKADIHGAAQARAAIESRAAAAGSQSEAARTSGPSPEIRARLAAIRQAAAQGK